MAHLGNTVVNGALRVLGQTTEDALQVTSINGVTVGNSPKFTDENNAVTQTATTTDANYEVLFSVTADNTTRTEGARKTTTLRFNPNKGALMEGNTTVASGTNAHAEGFYTTASGVSAHAEGGNYNDSTSYRGTLASGKSSHAEGTDTKSTGNFSHVEGWGSYAAGIASHAEGEDTTASGEYAHAEGGQTSAVEKGSHAEGFNTKASATYSHAEGRGSLASGSDSHAEGFYTTASGSDSHAEGYQTIASGDHSHASGQGTSAGGTHQTVIGKYNVADTSSAFIIGNGTSSTRSNALKIDFDGNFTTNKLMLVGKNSSRSTSTGGTWTAMCRSDQTGSPTCPVNPKWYNIINLGNWNDGSTDWVSQIAVATQDNPDGVWWRCNNASGTDISSSTWHRLANDDDQWAYTSGMTTDIRNGYRVTKTGGTAGWNQRLNSRISYRGNWSVSFRPAQANKSLMIGVSSAPTSSNGYENLMYAIYLESNSNLTIYHSGTKVGTFGTYATDDEFRIEHFYDQLRYYRNGSVFYSAWVSAASTALYLSSSFYDIGSAVYALDFKPVVQFARLFDNDIIYGATKYGNSGMSAFDILLNPKMRNNRLYGIAANKVTIEYSRDTGSTWTDYGASDGGKMAIFSSGTALNIGKCDATNKATANGKKYMLRITVDTVDATAYCQISKFHIAVSTNGSANCWCTIQCASVSAPSTFTDIVTQASIAGWSGWNAINTPPIQTSNSTRYIRFIFGADGGDTNYNGLQVQNILSFGASMMWSYPSWMALMGTPYNADEGSNTTFAPGAKVVMQGPLITSNTSSSGSWNECARFNRASSNGWATIYLGSSNGSTAGAQDYAWIIATPPSGTYGRRLVIGHNAVSDDSSTYFYTDSSTGQASLSIGYNLVNGNSCVAYGSYSHAEGYFSTAYNNYSHAEGRNSYSSGELSHAEGYYTTSTGAYSHAEGCYTRSYQTATHSEGYATTASNACSVSMGHFNAAMTTGGTSSNTTGTAFAIGNGTSNSALKNAFSVQFSGVVKAASTITASTTADYAEYFEWQDENLNVEDRVGYFVTFDSGDKIRIANNEDDYILGIVSGEPFVLGNGDCDVWNGMVLRDKFRRTIYEPAPAYEEVDGGKQIPKLDKNGKQIYEGTKPKYNPNYDPSKPYINRSDRPEWDAIGMLGVLAVRDDGTCEVNKYCTVNENGIATKWYPGALTKYRVIRRNDVDVVEVVFR